MADNRLPFFLAGLGVGAAAGLLLAPARGDLTRERLTRGAHEGKAFVSQSSDELYKVAEVAVGKGREAVQEQRANLESAFRAGMEAYRDASGAHW